MVFEKWLPLKWCVVCFLKALLYCYLFIIGKSIVLAWVLNTSIVSLSFLPHKDINVLTMGLAVQVQVSLVSWNAAQKEVRKC